MLVWQRRIESAKTQITSALSSANSGPEVIFHSNQAFAAPILTALPGKRAFFSFVELRLSWPSPKIKTNLLSTIQNAFGFQGDFTLV